jgi:protein tyrosine phosphatase
MQNIDNQKEYKVLFVCLGNICRSPAAEGIFKRW